jgi:3-mercaptopyruvate sulfurtransferase SseA
MKTEADWRNEVKGILKAELKRRNVSYQQLADKLAAMGVQDSPANIANKISRGSFTAVFLVQCLEAIGCKRVEIVTE